MDNKDSSDGGDSDARPVTTADTILDLIRLVNNFLKTLSMFGLLFVIGGRMRSVREKQNK